MTETRYLFVYGTLRNAANTEWSRFLSRSSITVGSGRTRGLLFQLDGYPGIVVSAHDDAWISGEVFQLNEPSTAWPILDSYEGCGASDPPPHEFERQVVDVVLDGDQTIRAHAYVYRLNTEGKERILSGEYLHQRVS
jgi:gamma-glutamylcyclotransferase (GGCT)/AIG2-like uncharacterized protein YtfP